MSAHEYGDRPVSAITYPMITKENRAYRKLFFRDHETRWGIARVRPWDTLTSTPRRQR